MKNAKRPLVLLGFLLAFGVAVPAFYQDRPLVVVSTSPNGEVGSLTDANEIRVVFSEPMVDLGGPAVTPPAWMTVTPAIRANYYWSGTRTLVVTADPDTPLPYATRFTVRIDGAARSAAGRPIASPRVFSFITPTVRLLGAEWYRRDGRADRPAVIALRFNQPVRPSDALAHVTVRYEPHPWTRPTISTAARERLQSENPSGLAKFEAKVDRTVRVAASTAVVPVALAASWDEKRFPANPNVVVIETTTPPEPDGWLRISTDNRLTAVSGTEVGPLQSTVIRLEPAFFVQDRCTSGCAPGFSSIAFRRNVAYSAVESALTIRDVTNGGDTAVARGARPNEGMYGGSNGSTNVALPGLGLPNQPPATRWLMKLDENLQSIDGQVLEYPWLEIVENLHAVPYAGWAGQVWESANGPTVPFVARNVTSVATWVAPIKPGDIFARLLRLQERNAQLTPDVPPIERRLSVEADVFEGHGTDLRSVLTAGGTGLAWTALSARSPLPNSAALANLERPLPTLVQVTNLGLTVKEGPQSGLVFVTRLDNAQPVSGARVSFHSTGGEVWTGTTGTDGVAVVPALRLRSVRNQWQLSYVVTAEKDGDVAWVGSDWSGDVHPSMMGIWSGLDERPNTLRGAVFFDRGIYTKGEEVKAKAVFRTDTFTGVQFLPAGARILVTTSDSRGQEVDRQVLPINRWSAMDWSIRLPAEAALGYYHVAARLEAQEPATQNQPSAPTIHGNFQVSAFRRPDFRVETTLVATTPILGSTLSGTVEARYLFGASLGRQPVRWYTHRSVVERIPDAIRQRFPERQFAFGYRPEPTPQKPLYQASESKTDSLDAEGRLKVEVPTTAGDDFASTLRLEGEVTNAAGQRIANRSEIVVHPASFYVGFGRPAFFVDSRRPFETPVIAASLDGVLRPGVAVAVSLWREQWVSERRPENPAFFNWVRKELPVGDWKVTTAASPAPLSVSIKEGGCYILRATAVDERGRPTRTDVRFYALGGGSSSWRTEGNRITLVPEQSTWKPGDTARILVQSPWEKATALVTKEREGIRTHSRVDITSAQDAITVPITEADVPNVFVSVVLVKGRTSADPTPDDADPGKPGFRLGYTELTVDNTSKKLSVAVRANREQFKPRERVDVNVTVADASGKPRASEVTLWAMDHGLLSLTDYKTPDVARAVYARRQLQVTTQDNRLRLIGKRSIVQEPAGVAIGAGGGGGRGGQVQYMSALAAPPPPAYASSAGDGLMQTRSSAVSMTLSESVSVEGSPQALDPGAVRRDFRPLVFWIGSASTDSAGRASTTVTLPDSLTTYRIMAVAGDLQSHFGAAETEIKTSKPLTMLSSFPRFLSQGDRASFGAIVTNNTGRTGEAVVRIQSLDPALELGATTTRTVRLAAGESQNVRFEASARAAGNARVRMTVSLGPETDAFEIPLSITAPVNLETVAAYGDTVAAATERVTLPAGALRDRGGLTVNLASTALVGLGESARFLQEYPYECAEQQASRALAMLLSADLGGAFGSAGAKPEELRATGLRLLSDLAGYQCGDGGYGLFPGSCFGPSSTYLTAYILHVYQRAAALGAKPDRFAMDRAINYLQNQLRQPPPEAQWWPAWAASQAFAVRVLAEAGRNPRADIDRLYGFADRMPVFALSYLADAFAAINDRGPRYSDVVRRLNNALRIDADRAHVQEVDDAALLWLWNTNVRATAVVLDGISRRRDDPAFVAPLVRWLLAARQNGRWGTTQENAVALGALVSYYKAFEAETPDLAVSVSLAGRQIGGAKFQGRTTTAHDIRLDMPALAAAVAGAVTRDLVVSRTGTGRLFYTARLQYATLTPPAAVDRGIRIERRYQPYKAGEAGTASTTFADGDLVRVTLTITLPHEGRFLAFTDPIPAGFEPVDGTLRTTAMDLAEVATTQPTATDRFAWWRRGGFDHVEKHDDKVRAFATRLGAGRHELTYLVRATTAGTFTAAGTLGEAMYAPEIMGRASAVTVTVR